MSKKDHKSGPPSREQFSLPEIELGDEGMVDLGELDMSLEGSSIPLADLPGPGSGQSLTSWTEVIRRQRAVNASTPPEADAVEVDAPSDRDLLSHVVESALDLKSLGRDKGDTSEIPQAELPVFLATPASESEIDLGILPAPRSGATGSDIRFDIAFPPSDAGGAMPIPKAGDRPLSGVDFTPLNKLSRDDDDAIPMAEASSGVGVSGLDLGADSSANETGRSSILDVLLQDSAMGADVSDGSALLDFGDDIPPIPPSKLTDGVGFRRGPAGTKPGIDLSESAQSSSPEDDLSLTGPDSAYGSDEAVDLYSNAATPASVSDSGRLEIADEVIEESLRRSESMDSSSVDMNSRPSFPGSDFQVELPEALPARGYTESDIDLDLPPIEDEAGSSKIVSKADLDREDAEVAAAYAARRNRNQVEDSSEQSAIVPSRSDVPVGKRRGYLLHGGVLGLLLGAGSMLAAYFGGALPDRGKSDGGSPPPPADNSAAVAQIRDQAFAAEKQAADSKLALDTMKKTLADAGVNPETAVADMNALKEAKTQSEARAKQLADDAKTFNDKLAAAMKAESEAKTTAETATSKLTDAEKTATEAKKLAADATKLIDAAKLEATNAMKALDLAKADAVAATKTLDEAKAETVAAKKAVDDAKAQTAAAKKAGDDALAALTGSLKSAGIDPAKIDDGIKKLVDARAMAETKEKEASAKLTEAVKQESEARKLAEATKKTAEDAVKARDAIDVTLKAVSERLAKAKFVGDKADSAAVLKGLDDALKATANDTSMAIRDELVKVRAAEAKLKTDLAAAKEKETEAAKLAVATQAEAKRAQDALKALETKTTGDAAKFKAEMDKLAKEANDAKAKSDAAAAEALTAKANAEKVVADVSRLKTENERLSKDLATVRELAELLKTPAIASNGSTKLDPAKLGERLFSDGLRAYYTGRYADAETAFRKAIQFKPDDARYHYLHGLSLWMTDDTKGAELSFEKGRELERDSRPSSRAISAVLERIQGPARQAVNAYRP